MASVSDGKSPSTPSKGQPRLPSAIANASLEDLQKMCLDTLKKLREKDRQIKELNAAAAAADAAVSSDGKETNQDSDVHRATVLDLQQQVEALSKQLSQQHSSAATAVDVEARTARHLGDLRDENAELRQQMVSLQETLPLLAAERDSAVKERDAAAAERDAALERLSAAAVPDPDSVVEAALADSATTLLRQQLQAAQQQAQEAIAEADRLRDACNATEQSASEARRAAATAEAKLQRHDTEHPEADGEDTKTDRSNSRDVAELQAQLDATLEQLAFQTVRAEAVSSAQAARNLAAGSEVAVGQVTEALTEDMSNGESEVSDRDTNEHSIMARLLQALPDEDTPGIRNAYNAETAKVEAQLSKAVSAAVAVVTAEGLEAKRRWQKERDELEEALVAARAAAVESSSSPALELKALREALANVQATAAASSERQAELERLLRDTFSDLAAKDDDLEKLEAAVKEAQDATDAACQRIKALSKLNAENAVAAGGGSGRAIAGVSEGALAGSGDSDDTAAAEAEAAAAALAEAKAEAKAEAEVAGKLRVEVGEYNRALEIAKSDCEIAERQVKQVQEMLKSERKVHAAALGDQVMKLADAAADAETVAAKTATLEQQLAAALAEASAVSDAVGQLREAQGRVADLQAEMAASVDVMRQLAEAQEEILRLEAQLAASLGGSNDGRAPGVASSVECSSGNDGNGVQEEPPDDGLRQQVSSLQDRLDTDQLDTNLTDQIQMLQGELERSARELSMARGELVTAQEDLSRQSSASEDRVNVAMDRVHVLETANSMAMERANTMQQQLGDVTEQLLGLQSEASAFKESANEDLDTKAEKRLITVKSHAAQLVQQLIDVSQRMKGAESDSAAANVELASLRNQLERAQASAANRQEVLKEHTHLAAIAKASNEPLSALVTAQGAQDAQNAEGTDSAPADADSAPADADSAATDSNFMQLAAPSVKALVTSEDAPPSADAAKVRLEAAEQLVATLKQDFEAAQSDASDRAEALQSRIDSPVVEVASLEADLEQQRSAAADTDTLREQVVTLLQQQQQDDLQHEEKEKEQRLKGQLLTAPSTERKQPLRGSLSVDSEALAEGMPLSPGKPLHDETAGNSIPADSGNGQDTESSALEKVVAERNKAMQDLVDAKRKFVGMARRKQAEYAAKVKELEAEVAQLKQHLAEAHEAAADAIAAKQAYEAASRPEAEDEAQAEVMEQMVSLQLQLAAQSEELSTARAAAEDAQEVVAEAISAREAADGAAESARTAVARSRRDQEGERERVKKAMGDMKRKIDRLSKEKARVETTLAEAAEAAAAATREAAAAEAAAEESTNRAAAAAQAAKVELDGYKARAHVLLKGKEADLKVARAALEATPDHTTRLVQAETLAAAATLERLQSEEALAAAQAEHRQRLRDVEAAFHCQIQDLETEVQLFRHQADVASAARQQSDDRCQEAERAATAAAVRLAAAEEEVSALRESHAAAAAYGTHSSIRGEGGGGGGEPSATTTAAAVGEVAAAAEAAEAAEKLAEAREAEVSRLLAANAALRGELAAAKARLAELTAGSVVVGVSTPRGTEGAAARSLPFDDDSDFGEAFDASSAATMHLRGSISPAASRQLRHGRESSHVSIDGDWPSCPVAATSAAGGSPRSGGDQRGNTMHTAAGRDSFSGLQGLLDDLGSSGSGGSSLVQSQLLQLAHRQAARDAEAAAATGRVRQLEEDLREVHRELALRIHQEVALKEALRDVDRAAERAALSDRPVDMTYLKNTMLQLYSKGEMVALLPVVATMLSFSPSETASCREYAAKWEALAGAGGEGSGEEAGLLGNITSFGSWFARGAAVTSVSSTPDN